MQVSFTSISCCLSNEVKRLCISFTVFIDMKPFFFLYFLFPLFAGVAQSPSYDKSGFFEIELQSLQAYFHIPGLAVLVQKGDKIIYENYMGFADLETNRPVDAQTVFPIMSLSKTFASTLCLQMADEGILDLGTSIQTWLPESKLPSSVTLQHLLSHTSEGVPGTTFNYSSRYSLISSVLEKVSGKPYEEILQERIITPLGLSHTLPLVNQQIIDSLGSSLASPYYFYGKTEKGHFDTGLSAASGLSSTPRDLATFLQGLDEGKLLAATSRQRQMTAYQNPDGDPLPYGLGIFSQNWEGKKLVWGYGQEDCFSSLLLSIPEDGTSLILLANNNLMSDPARLINGDIRYSLFALAFLKHFVYSQDDWSLPTLITSDYLEESPPSASDKPFDRQILLANALAASFLGQGFPEEGEKSKALTLALLKHFPDIKKYGTISTLHLLSVLCEQEDDPQLVSYFLALGKYLIDKQADNPYSNIYMAFFYKGQNNPEKALPYFQAIVDAENYRPFWYTIEAWYELGMYYRVSQPGKARTYMQNIIDLGWNIGSKLVLAKQALKDWE